MASEGERRRPRVLIVDDYADAADLLAEALAFAGYEVSTANDGPSALALLEEVPFGAAFIDIGMPSMDGYEVARRMRGSAVGAGMYLVALTGHSGDADKKRSADAGFDLHLVKPVDVTSLSKLLDSRFGI